MTKWAYFYYHTLSTCSRVYSMTLLVEGILSDKLADFYSAGFFVENKQLCILRHGDIMTCRKRE